MKWFKKLFDNQPEYESIVTDVPLTAIARWYLYDTGMGNENEVAELIGLNPVSDEGDVKERQDSDERVSHIVGMLPFIDFISDIAADSIAQIQNKEMEKSGLTTDSKELAEELEIMRTVYKAISLSSLIGAMSIASSLGMISIDTVSSDILERYGEDEQ